MVMDRASWLWRRKALDKSPGGSDSSISVSSHSEQCSDDQEILRPISNNASPCIDQSPEVGVTKSLNGKLATGVNSNGSTPQHGQSIEPHVSSNVRDEEVKETMKSLNDKLSAALLTIKAKEDLVKQHAKVTEEAVAGWEQAEAEVTALKGLLEASSQKNASLEDRVSHLDKALKECVRQLRLAREQQEEKIHDLVAKKSQVLESENSELQNQIAELKKRLEVTRFEASSMLLQHDLQEKFQATEKENLDLTAKLQAIEKESMDLKAKLLVQSKDMKILLLERDLSNQAAETASKQHLESIKKIVRIEAECHRLQHLTRKATLVNDSRHVQNNVCMESLTDSHSDNGERMVVVDNELRNSDSWASALIAELDQFKNGKDGAQNLVNNPPVEIDIMDDFLEMERLAALPESDRTSSTSETETDSDKAVARNNSSKVETEELQNQVPDLQEKFEAISSEKRELEMALMEVRNQLDISCDALVAAKNRLIEMQMQLDSANNSKLAALGDVERLDSERKSLELQLESKSVEVEELLMVITSLEENVGLSQLELMSTQAAELRLTVASLEEKVQVERALSVQQKANAKAMWNAKEEMEAQLCSANTEMGKLRDIVKALENEVEKEKALHEELTAQLQVKIEAAVDAVKESLEAQLCSANSEVEKLQDVIKALEGEVEKEKALHEELAAQVEVKIEAARTLSVEAAKESLEAQLCSANTEIQKLHEMTKALENEVEKEKALHEELSAQLETKIEAEKTLFVESVKESLEEQLQLANSEAVKLRDLVTALEHDVKEKEFSAELQMQLEALEAIKRVLESEVESAHQVARNLNQKVDSLEAKLKEQMSSAEEFTAKAESLQSERMAMEHQLETAERELIKLTNRVSLLHREIEQERLLSEEYEQKCRKLEAQLSRDSRDAKLWRLANANGELKVKKEKELANAAGKLAECQKTIASLGRQLKSLTDLDSVVLEPERQEPRDMPLPLDFRNGNAQFTVFADELYDFDLPNGNGGCFSPLPSIQPSSPPSEMSVFAGGLSTLSSYRSKRASRR